MAEVIIAVPTFRRPLWLARLLEAVEALETKADILVLVADNDPDALSGLEVCGEAVRNGYRWPLEGIVVAERGIAQVRNALVAHALARGNSGFLLAMLDDDEWPSPQWLEEMLRVQRETGADIVQGPVICYFDSEPKAWARLANATEAPRTGSGPIARAEAGGNVLLTSACLARSAAPWFDPQFGLTGGEDKDFFMQTARAGAHFAWAEEALAFTTIPASRTTLGWALKRAFRAGNCDWRITRKYDRSLRTLGHEGAKLVGALALSPLRMMSASPAQRAKAAFTFARALGKAAAPLGGSYQEYRRTHGL